MSLPAWIAQSARIRAEGPHATCWPTLELDSRVQECSAAMLSAVGSGGVIGLLADNSPDWIAIDLAAQQVGIDLVPLPAFFTTEQMKNAICAARIQAFFCSKPALARGLGFVDEIESVRALRLWRRPGVRADDCRVHRDARKITFTSGTTQNPKGVVLSVEEQLRTARALASVLSGLNVQRHLCALPLSVLLENVAGVYTALMLGASCACPHLEDVGLVGSVGFNPQRCLDAIAQYRPDTLILLPEMLRAIVGALSARGSLDSRIRSLKFVAVGGAKTRVSLIRAARELGVPVYEGYGITECGSVVSVNRPGADRLGTVGKPLAGVGVRIAADSEIEIAGRSHSGYVGCTSGPVQEWFRSGDLGAIDADGFIQVTGRKSNVLVTSFGRNVSPEWPESLLLENALIAQAVVFGHTRPYLAAILTPTSPHIGDAAVEAIVREVNTRLPDYARVRAWIRAHEPFAATNGLATANGRVRRDAVLLRYGGQLSALFDNAGERGRSGNLLHI